MKLEYKFRDNESIISFDVNNNSVLYGMNGSGKTRVLKSLSAVSNIGKNNRRVIDIFEEYNLDYLKVNGISLEELLKKRTDQQENFSSLLLEFVKVNGSAFEDLKMVISAIIDDNRFVPFFPISRFENFVRRIDRIITPSVKIDLYREISFLIRSVTNEIRELDMIARRFAQDVELNQSMLEFAKDVISFISRRFDDYKFSNDVRGRQEDSLREAIAQTELFNNDKYAKYISTDLMELDLIIDVIEKEIFEIREAVANEYLSKKGQEGILKQNKKINIFFGRLESLNKFLKRYANVQINLSENGYNRLVIYKSGEEIEFEKLSSGEKRIIILFANVIFSDEKILLFDEPEVSLSLNYQSKLMDDICRLLEGKTLILATHAPFIYKACERLDFDLIDL